MTRHCPEDGCFIGDAGCTSERHNHTPLVDGIIKDGKAKRLHAVSEADCDAALNEGFYVDGPNGKRIGFGKKLLDHLNEHDPEVAADRKRKLLYAVNTVMFPEKSENDHRRVSGRTAYFKRFDKFGIQAVTSREGDRIEYVFTHIVKYSEGKGKGNGAARSLGITSATASRGFSRRDRFTAFPPRSVEASSDPNTDGANDTTTAHGAQGGE